MSQWVYSLSTGSDWKSLTAARRAKKELNENEVVGDGVGILFCSVFYAPSLTTEPVERLMVVVSLPPVVQRLNNAIHQINRYSVSTKQTTE